MERKKEMIIYPNNSLHHEKLPKAQRFKILSTIFYFSFLILLIFKVKGQPTFPGYTLTNFVNNIVIRPSIHPTSNATLITNNPQMNTGWANIGYLTPADKLLLTWNNGIYNGAGNDIMIVCFDHLISGTANIRLLLSDGSYTPYQTVNFTTNMIVSPILVTVSFQNIFSLYGNTIYTGDYHPAGKAIDITSFYSGALSVKGIEFTNTTNIYLDLIAVAATQNAILPITLSNFSVTVRNNSPYLNWQTVSELNASHFEIERSTDGYNFISVGKIVVSSNYTTNGNYFYSDNEGSAAGYYFYRLKLVDLDGTFTLSKIVKIKMRDADPSYMKINYNSFNRKLSCIGGKIGANCYLFNSSGQVILHSIITSFETCLYLNKLSHGIYYIKVDGEKTKGILLR